LSIALFLTVQGAEYFASLDPPSQCVGPRVRYSWTDLTPQQQQDYVNTIDKMKTSQITLSEYKTLSLYDLFTEMHNENACQWHSSSYFFVVHRYFLWKFESAVQFIARAYGSSFNPPIVDPCSVTVPYWNWEVDFQNLASSAIFNPKLFGPPPPATRKTIVTSGAFANWPAPYLQVLERQFNSVWNNQASGVATLMRDIVNHAEYSSYSKTIYGAHGIPHMYIGQQMQTMYSPSDPLFWSHHSNIDRLFALWQDCHDYEVYNETSITSDLYSPYSPPGTTCTGSPDYGLDTPMPFYYQGGHILPFPEFPTPRQVYFMGNSPNDTGYDGIYFRYGNDLIVQNYISDNNNVYFCEANIVGWNLVNQSPDNTKRGFSSSNSTSSFNSSNLLSTLEFLQNSLNIAEDAGLSGLDVLNFIADLECQTSTQREVTEQLEMWIIMEGSQLSWYDRSCDNTSAIFCANNPNNTLCETSYSFDLADKRERAETQYMMIIAVVEGVVIVLLLIIIVVSFIRSKRVDDPDGYTSFSQ